MIIYKAVIQSPNMPSNSPGYLFSFVKGEGESRDSREDVANVAEETAEEHRQEACCWPSWV